MVPAASVTAMVSPMAREMASTMEATMPERAAGTTTRSDTTRRVAPSPNAPSRIELGTARMASSDRELMSGVISRPTTMPAARALYRPSPGKTI